MRSQSSHFQYRSHIFFPGPRKTQSLKADGKAKKAQVPNVVDPISLDNMDVISSQKHRFFYVFFVKMKGKSGWLNFQEMKTF